MKKILTLIISSIALLTGCSSTPSSTSSSLGGNSTPSNTNSPVTGESNALVAYFSWSSSRNTEIMAGYVTDATGGDTFRIRPETPYTTDYNEVIQIAQEERNNNARPALAENISEEDFANYDVVFLGYPIWWYDAPMIIYTFIESHDFTGKTIVPFATSGGSGIQEENKFRQITNATVLEGLCIPSFRDSDSNRNRVNEWVEGLGYSNSSSSESVADVEMKMTFASNELIVKLNDNSATRDLVQRLRESPITLTFEDYAGSEKIAHPNPSLDLSNTEGYDPEVGDLMIYTPWNNLCAFYRDSASYSDSLVLVGHIQDDGIELLAAQTADFDVVLSLN